MMRALFSGVTGLRSHQTKMDVIGNNISNVNTVGYKKNTVTFKDLYNETISAAAASSGAGQTGTGGVNAKQIGLGAAVDSITAVHSPGSAQYTGNGMDVAISGDGYFAVQSATGLQYTRAGNFYTDLTGNLVTSQGYYVMTVPPKVTVTQKYSVDSVATNGLINQAVGVRDAAHTGQVTADLNTLIGSEFGFVYEPSADGPWSVIYGEGTGDSYTPPASTNVTGTLSVKAIKDQLIKLAGQGTNIKAATKDISFTQVDTKDPVSGLITSSKVTLKFGDIPIASGTVSPVTDPIAANTGTAKVNFILEDGSGTSIGELEFTNKSSTALPLSSLTDSVFSKMSAKPNLTLQEEGQWYLTQDGSKIEPVVFSYTETAAGGLNGTVMFSTAQYGGVVMQLDDGKIANMNALNSALSGRSFEVNVRAENVPEYAPPIGVLQQDLTKLQVNFDNYANLTIDASGAVMAQLKSDQQVEIDGKIVNMSTGDKVVLGYVAMASFNNPTGLEKVGDNLFVASSNSGVASFGLPGDGTRGSLSPSNLEMSNVDLSEEMVNMIITQRGFQANSRIITTTDTMLEELVNLKR